MGKQIDIATSNATPPAGVACYGYTYGGHKFLKSTELAAGAPETRLYLGGAEFVEGQPESYYHGEGRVALTGSEPRFQYKLTDHLGNTMVLFEDKDGDKIITTESNPAENEVLQRNFYYAFGLPMQGPWNHAPADPDMPYLYNGKELEGELGLGWYAYGFRYYDASVGRFAGVDPLAGEMPDWSPYGYAYSNPISFIDFMGLAPEWIDNGDGTYTAEAGDSAYSLAKDAGISNSTANSIVESQLGANYIGAEGGLKSNVEEGDVVRVNSNSNLTDVMTSTIGTGDAGLTLLGGIGLNATEISRYGNEGGRFRARLFGTNFMLRGEAGSKIVSGINVLGPLMSFASISLSLTSDNPVGFKVADTVFGLAGAFGGTYGAGASLGYTFGIRPLVRAVVLPTREEDQARWSSHVKYCNSQSRCQ